MTIPFLDSCAGCSAPADPDLNFMCKRCYTRWWQTTNEASSFLRKSKLILDEARRKAGPPCP